MSNRKEDRAKVESGLPRPVPESLRRAAYSRGSAGVRELANCNLMAPLMRAAGRVGASRRKGVRPTWKGFLHLAIVLDALNMAVAQRRSAGVIHHADHGQCAALAFGERCRQLGGGPRLGTVGTPTTKLWPRPCSRPLECELIDATGAACRPRHSSPSFASLEG